MIQRIQSVYLALVGAIGIILFFVPFGVSVQKGIAPEEDTARMLKMTSLTVSSGGKTETASIPYFLIAVNLLVTVQSFIIIRGFKNRKKQLLFCRFLMVFICILVGMVFWYAEQLKSPDNPVITYLIGTYLPVIQLILTYMAERAIKKDDELVRSADRLR